MRVLRNRLLIFKPKFPIRNFAHVHDVSIKWAGSHILRRDEAAPMERNGMSYRSYFLCSQWITSHLFCDNSQYKTPNWMPMMPIMPWKDSVPRAFPFLWSILSINGTINKINTCSLQTPVRAPFHEANDWLHEKWILFSTAIWFRESQRCRNRHHWVSRLQRCTRQRLESGRPHVGL